MSLQSIAIPLDADQSGPPHARRARRQQLVHARPGLQLLNGDGAPDQSHASRSGERLESNELRLTHSFSSSFVYMLPWGPQGLWFKDGGLGKALGDWQVTGLISAISGTPIDFTAANAGLAATGNTQTPNVTGTPEVLGGIGSNKLWFDTSVFSAPAAGTWGTAGVAAC